ncbi:sensor histidine kinase [Kordiimonas pumila]|uniref:histidine kinase n=1 Tax=Kordiimonas pumila TaxID=2161677 RepID=A0ABV7D8P3_9PROT|nr:sensor histidine kinase [Kordiimonas pumila]
MKWKFADLRSSLTSRLLVGLIMPTAALALLLGVGGAFTIQNIVESVNDRLLSAAGQAIADTVALEDGEVTLDLPVAAFGMLENEERDNVYYSVRRGKDLITGYKDLPVIDWQPTINSETRYMYSSYRGHSVRIVAISRRVPRVAEPVIVQIAETLTARTSLRNQMLIALILLELLLITILVFLLPVAVKWGLAPLSRIQKTINSRAPTDFTPIGEYGVPIEMRNFITAFNGLITRLQDAVQGIRRFTADASHQMRTPLSVLRAHLEVIRREGLESAAGRESFADVEAATVKLQRLLTQLLALARAEGAKERITSFMEPVDLVGLLREIAETYVPAALKENVELQFESPVHQLQVSSVEVFARELLANLVDNAIRYNNGNGFVWLSIRLEEKEAIIRVEDNGPGIPAEARVDIFKRFRRVPRDQQAEGSGLGLAIVETLAEAIGVKVRVTDRVPAPGLCVDVHFPIMLKKPLM